MNELTLREVCTTYNVSRRAVQGYEKAGLVAATGKTSRGYLLYDEKAQKQIVLIRQFQHFGFHVREIENALSLPPPELKALLEEKKTELTAKCEEINAAINRISELIRELKTQDIMESTINSNSSSNDAKQKTHIL